MKGREDHWVFSVCFVLFVIEPFFAVQSLHTEMIEAKVKRMKTILPVTETPFNTMFVFQSI